MEIRDQAEELYARALDASREAYAPYSKVRVGAALLTEGGRVILACNVENASLGLTICAERAAVFKAVSEGETRFQAIAVAFERSGPGSPCGACRQVLYEFSPAMSVIYRDTSGKLLTRPLKDLMPDAFGL